MTSPTYSPQQYSPNVTDSGALKLADSAVAPLVASARGYSWLQQDAVKTFVADKGMGPGTRRLRGS